ncbi:MAG: hypothetical protein ACK4ND_03405 [Cytophagaceae bacterium]
MKLHYTFFLLSLFLITGFKPTVSQEIPELNQKILEFVKSKINQKVGRGECWDLAAEALNSYGAIWDGKYKYGRKVNPKKEPVYPGDIIQFEKIELTYVKDGCKYKESMPHHTAIIYAVKGDGVYELAHQNTSYSGKTVGLTVIDLKTKSKGKYIIYRPQARTK